MNQIPSKNFADEIRRPLESEGLHIAKALGKGAFGQVFLCAKGTPTSYNRFLTHSDGVQYAVKSISKEMVKKRPFLEKYIKQQIQAMKILKHPNLVTQEKVLETHEFYFMVLQYCDGGNLLTYQAKLPSKTFSLQETLAIMIEIIKGLRVIHEQNYIHRDIKSENVLIKSTKDGGKIYKIADFGFARPVQAGTASTVCGTEKYMAPEILRNETYNRSVDIWALGILMYFMLYAEYPFKGHDLLADIDRKCKNGFKVRDVVSKIDKLKQTTPELEDFFRNIFIMDSKKRMGFKAMMSHPLFTPYQKDFEQNKQIYEEIDRKEVFMSPPPPDKQQAYYYQVEDETREELLVRDITLNNLNKMIAHEIETVSFEIAKIAYLRESANDFYTTFTNVINYEERVAIRYYVMRAFVFFSKQLLMKLEAKQIPKAFETYNLTEWLQFTNSAEYKILLHKIKEENLKGELEFDDAYNLAVEVADRLKIKNFKDKLTPTVDDIDFESFKIPYRSTTSYVFKKVHDNKQLEAHVKNKMKMKLFCCHMINRIFDQNELDNNFEYYVAWLKQKDRQGSRKFDFVNFKKWMLCDTKENIDKNITLLHKIFFSK